MNLNDYKKLGENLSSVRSCRRNSTEIDPEDLLKLEEQSWNDLDSLHSRGSTTDQSAKSWTTMDSIHSKTETGVPSIMDIGNGSFNLDESSSSFASFGDSATDLFSETIPGSPTKRAGPLSELSIQSRQFRSLSDGPTPRSILLTQQNMKYQRAGMRHTSLTLIEESKSLD